MPQRTDIDITTADGICPSVLITPDGDGPWPGVIFFMDAGGVRQTLVSMAEQLAGLGYVVLLPELYYRAGTYEPIDVDTVFTDPEEQGRMMALVGGLTLDMAARDTGALIDVLLGLPSVSGTKVGTTGYCMGGGISLTAAGRHPDRIAASASFHGANLASDAPDSPHLLAGRITGRVYVAAAEGDAYFPPEQVNRLDEALTAAGVDHTVETYPAAHGFAVPDNPTYDVDASARHWRALEDFFSETLTN